MKWKLIWFILALAFFLRFVSLTQFPAGLNADEASFGYDAYSILQTGRDQWGNTLPIVLKSFGDFKSPVYAYLAVPSVAIFGLNTFATRLPNVIIGTLSVLAVYLLVQEILKLKIANSLEIGKDSITSWGKLEIVASLLLAVNPWSVMISRGAVEANLISFFLPLGVYFFLRGLKDNNFFAWSAIFMGITMFTYHSAKLITPVVFVSLIFIFRKQLLKIDPKKLTFPVLLFLVFFVGMLYTFKIGGGSRISERSITQGAILQGFDERMSAIANGSSPKLAKIFHNKYQVTANRFVKNYFQYFSPKFLIQQGVGNASYAMIPGIGVVSILEILFLFGIIPLLIYRKDFRKTVLVLLLSFMVTPLPAALASGGGYSGNRASGMLPVLQIIEAFGFYGWMSMIGKVNYKYTKGFILVSSLLFIFGAYNLITFYYKTQQTEVLKQQGYGNLQVFSWLKDNLYDRNVIVSRSISEPQIFVAFANKWEPYNYQENTKTWGFDTANIAWVDQLPEYSLGNYKFKSVDWETDTSPSTLIVVRAEEFKDLQTPLKVFNYSDGTPNIYIIDTDQKIYANNIK